MKRYILILLSAVMAFTGQSNLFAAEAGNKSINIVAFDDTEVELKIDDKYQYIEVSELGELPIAVVEENKDHWLKITTTLGESTWVARSSVKTDEEPPIKNCHSIKISQAADRGQSGVRGAGEKCK